MTHDVSAEIAAFLTAILDAGNFEADKAVHAVHRKFPHPNNNEVWRGFRIARELRNADNAYQREGSAK